ncbi:Peptidoglycan/LPS O-acetylase OafA/YrhL, contains acyltransferase and SGNH-hydrolase domains [Flavobacterium resistens]|uniref:Acyltransferase family protein n=1 Tax=Flavobacterium resistens TaxID=443612 RepID=A0A521CXS9_9FLAO|nr:acyltransferase [Flavobacterium resistens]MRX67021.1 acyltransferase family protein [Flavobacterium resistens]SMO63470.1 Peptidoglycan/LPS O-acetylase OafA/YrhL, contains acyltransferase and SGNH-hydrolase domains [Flavobacterium resistens]
MTNFETIKPKQHFKILDGLRGVAAIAVVIYHFLEIAISDYSKNLFAHSFLAVDFFFCLSGFVIAYAYDDRIAKIGIVEFFKLRLIRLHPLVVLGSILGLIGYFVLPYGDIANRSISEVLLLFICSLLLIPLPIMKERYYNNFGLNAPAWSLFWEYIANIFYSIFLYRLSRKMILLLTCIAGIALVYVSYHAKGISGGWGGDTFWHGAARISYCFLAGMTVYRFKWIIPSKIGFLGLSLLLFPTFIYPFNQEFNFITEPLIVLFYFPFIIALGAGTETSKNTEKVCVFSGNISYPLYMTHYFAMWIFASYNQTYKFTGPTLYTVVFIGTLLLIGFAYLVMTYIDVPIRKYLTGKNKVQKA